jgi:polyisoprenoid-binding protein YceI
MSTTRTALPTGTWNVDPSHSRVGFRVRHLGISTVRGEFHGYEGRLVVGEDGDVSASGTVQVDSVDTADAGRDTHLKSADFFDVETYPEITFQSTSVTAKDEDTYEIVGDLTMHGVTTPITLRAEVGGSTVDPMGNERVGLEVTGELRRSDFGMKFNMPLGGDTLALGDKIKLELDISAIKQADA